MSATTYNPNTPPDPAFWLGLSESERLRLALNFHVSQQSGARNLKAHALLHVVVENYIATGLGPAVRALSRLQSQELSRHEAIHAIAAVVAEHTRIQTSGPPPAFNHQAALNAALESLAAQSGRSHIG